MRSSVSKSAHFACDQLLVSSADVPSGNPLLWPSHYLTNNPIYRFFYRRVWSTTHRRQLVDIAISRPKGIGDLMKQQRQRTHAMALHCSKAINSPQQPQVCRPQKAHPVSGKCDPFQAYNVKQLRNAIVRQLARSDTTCST